MTGDARDKESSTYLFSVVLPSARARGPGGGGRGGPLRHTAKTCAANHVLIPAGFEPCIPRVPHSLA